MKRSVVALIAGLAAAILFVAPSFSAGPAATSVALKPQARLGTSGELEVTVIVQCPPGSNSGSVVVYVSQPQPDESIAEGSAGSGLICTGDKETVALTVIATTAPAAFAPGRAVAQAVLTNPFNQSVADARILKIA